jgi:hypothetical protein
MKENKPDKSHPQPSNTQLEMQQQQKGINPNTEYVRPPNIPRKIRYSEYPQDTPFRPNNLYTAYDKNRYDNFNNIKIIQQQQRIIDEITNELQRIKMNQQKNERYRSYDWRRYGAKPQINKTYNLQNLYPDEFAINIKPPRFDQINQRTNNEYEPIRRHFENTSNLYTPREDYNPQPNTTNRQRRCPYCKKEFYHKWSECRQQFLNDNGPESYRNNKTYQANNAANQGN